MSIDPSPITREQRTRADEALDWNAKIRTLVEDELSQFETITQFAACNFVTARLRKNLMEYSGKYVLEVLPKDTNQIRVTAALDKIVTIRHTFNIQVPVDVAS